MSPKSNDTKLHTPDNVPLTMSQAQILSSLTKINADDLFNLSVAEISERYRWQVDPELLFFVQICGTVVKPGPDGTQWPVPFATVYVEDTVCSLLGFFPEEYLWSWFFPWDCRTNVIAQTTTDQCGNFCVWVPRFIIEWVLRFRLERICFLEVLAKPTVGSVLQYLQGDNATVNLRAGTALHQRAEQVLGADVTKRLAGLTASQEFGSTNAEQRDLLARPAFRTAMAPPLPRELRASAPGRSKKDQEAVNSTLANLLNLDAPSIAGLDLGRYYGPFLRCIDVIVPEWVPVLEVPDISFRVTQDINGTGTPEVIYSGGLFEVPLGTGNISGVTLVASPIAAAVPACGTPEVACGDVPSLQFVGLMPLENPPLPAAPYVNVVSGFALRPNPPHPSGTIAGPPLLPASAPYTGTLQLYGCTEVDGAVYYRVRYTYTAPGTTTPSAVAPFVGLTWPLYREVGTVLQTLWPVSDAQGWYPILPVADDWFPASMVLEWGTNDFADGLYTLQLEVGDASKAVLATSTQVGFVVDNSEATITYSAIWSFNADMSGNKPVPTTDCAVIDRGTTPKDVYIEVTFNVTENNLRSVSVNSGGCAGGAVLQTPVSTVQHWYENTGDTSFGGSPIYKIPATYPQGVYGFDVDAVTRAFNPAGADSGPLDDWFYSPQDNWVDPSFAVAVVNEN